MNPSNRSAAWLIIACIFFTIINPTTAGDVMAFCVIAAILMHKLFGEYLLFVFLILRPTLDIWRDISFLGVGGIDLNINAALSIILLAWSGLFFLNNKKYWKKIPLKAPWLTFIAWCALSFIYSFDRGGTITETIKMANLFSLFGMVYIFKLKYPDTTHTLIYKSLLGGAALPLAFGLGQAVTGSGATIDDVPNRIFGTFAHPNLLATFTLLLCMAGAEYIYRFRLSLKGTSFLSSLTHGIRSAWHHYRPVLTQTIVPRLQPLALVGGVFLGGIIMLTYTRVAWIGLALFLLSISALYYRRVCAGIILGVILFYTLFYPVNSWLKHSYNINLQSLSVINRLTARNEEADSIQWRADIANKITPLFWRRPLLGYGYGSFSKVWNDNRGTEHIWDTGLEAHNDYLKIGFETGFIGLGLFLLLFLAAGIGQLKQLLAGKPVVLVFSLSVLIYLAMSLSDNMLHHTPVIWWFAALWGYWYTAEES